MYKLEKHYKYKLKQSHVISTLKGNINFLSSVSSLICLSSFNNNKR